MSGQPEKLSERLRRWRKINGWNQVFAAKKLGVNYHTYRQWDNGRQEPQGLGREALEKKLSAWEKTTAM